MGLWLLWLCWVRLGAAEEETLLNTRLATSDLQWTVYPPGEGQWEELSALDEELQAPVRTFEVCSWLGPPGPPQNSWLRSGWVPRRGATHVYAELRFTLLACDSLPRPRARARRAPRPAPTRDPRGERPTDPCPDRPSDPRPDQAAPGDGHGGHREEPGDAPWDLGSLGGAHREQEEPGDGRGGHRGGPGGGRLHSRLGSALGERFGHQEALDDGPGGHHEAPGGHQAPPDAPPAHPHAALPQPLSSAAGALPSAAAFPTPPPGAPRDRSRRGRRSFPPRRCKETFNVFYHESDADTATALSPPWLENPYVKVDTVAAEHLSRRPPPAAGGGAGAAGRPSGKVNLKTLRLGPLRRAGFYLALQDLGACLALLSVRLFLRRCPAATALLASFPPTLPSELLTPARGRCLRGAVQLGGSPPLMYCREDGRWAEPPTHGCACGPGHQHDPGGGGGCRACPPDSYKAEVGEGLCQPCPPLSQAPGPGASLCGCRPGFYRAPGEGPELRCSAPPSAPRSLRALLNGSEVRLEWSSPAQGGSRQDLSFRVGCRECPQAGGAAGGAGPCGPCRGLSFEPGAGELRGRGVSARGLRPGVAYSFSVTAHSGVSALSPLPPPAASINVSVGHVPPPVADVVRVGGTPTGVTLAWPSPPPRLPPGDPILDYEVKYYEKVGGGEGPPMFLKVPVARAELGGLRRGGVYGVRVRARSQAGYGEFGPETTVSAPAAEGSRGGPGGVVAGAAVLGGVLVLALLGGSLLCLRRRRHRSREDSDQVQPGEQGRKFYIDPLSYEDPGVALRDLAPEIDPSWVTIEEVIGAGEFGEVCRASLALPGAPPLPVAVKTLKGGAGEGQLRDFLREAARMAPLRHRHVVRLQGVVSAAGSAMILTEYMENGALDAFLRARVGALGTLQLVGLLRGVAAGMRYLADAGFVHRDLAARNVLLDAHLVPKVSDFGLARALQGPACADPTYTSCMGGKIPIRWTAPEAIAWRQFTSASDVWSYGIVMWEVMAFGERPYWDMSNQDVLNAIEQDYRLPPPAGCPAPLHRLMLACWRRHRSLRPRFAALLRALDRLIRDPCALRRPAAGPPSPPQLAQLSLTEAPGPPAAPWDSVGEWLRGLLPGPPEEPPGNDTSGRDPLPRDLLSLGVPLAGQQQQTLDSAQSAPKADPHF